MTIERKMKFQKLQSGKPFMQMRIKVGLNIMIQKFINMQFVGLIGFLKKIEKKYSPFPQPTVNTEKLAIFVNNFGSSGTIRTCNLILTEPLLLPKGLDYLITRN